MNYSWREGNQADLLATGEDYFSRVFACIHEAREEVLLETFRIAEDDVGLALQQALIAAANRGVRVELTADNYGTHDLSPSFVSAMTDAGVHVHLFAPAPRLFGCRTTRFRRLHRNVLVIDGEHAFIGSFAYSTGHSSPDAAQNYALAVRGPVVADIHRDALNQLPDAGRQANPIKPVTRHAGSARLRLTVRDNDTHTHDIESEYLRIIQASTQRLVIASACFFPRYPLLREIRNAARRGVKVTLLLQGQAHMPWAYGFSRLLYDYLLRDGVVIHEYDQAILHGKVALADHEWVSVGSSNLDPLSLALNLEANLMVRDAPVNRSLHDHLLEQAHTHCRPVELQPATRGYWWRIPLIVLGFQCLRHFPALAGWFPAHTPRRPLIDAEQAHLQYDSENAA